MTPQRVAAKWLPTGRDLTLCDNGWTGMMKLELLISLVAHSGRNPLFRLSTMTCCNATACRLFFHWRALLRASPPLPHLPLCSRVLPCPVVRVFSSQLMLWRGVLIQVMMLTNPLALQLPHPGSHGLVEYHAPTHLQDYVMG